MSYLYTISQSIEVLVAATMRASKRTICIIIAVIALISVTNATLIRKPTHQSTSEFLNEALILEEDHDIYNGCGWSSLMNKKTEYCSKLSEDECQ